jgi:hypothetical protein
MRVRSGRSVNEMPNMSNLALRGLGARVQREQRGRPVVGRHRAADAGGAAHQAASALAAWPRDRSLVGDVALGGGASP